VKLLKADVFASSTQLLSDDVDIVQLLHTDSQQRLVGWSLGLTSLFSTNAAISETKGQGWRVILLPSEGRLAIY